MTHRPSIRAKAWRLVIGALIALVVSTSASAQTLSDGHAMPRLLAEQRYDEARALLTLQLGMAPDFLLHSAHLEALIALSEGRPEAAIILFRAVLSREPDFVPARLELARVLSALGQFEAASYHFRILSLHRDPSVRAAANAGLARTIANQPYGASAYLTLSPSTNINRGSNHGIFVAGGLPFLIADDGRKAAGLGIGIGVSGFARHALDANTALVARLGSDPPPVSRRRRPHPIDLAR